MTSPYRSHDTGHERIITALKSLPRRYAARVKSQLARIDCCNHSPLMQQQDGTFQPVAGPDGKVMRRGWHCNSPLCHRAAVTKAEKTAEKYMLRAATRIKFGHYAVTLTSVPVAGKSLREAFRQVERARSQMVNSAEFKRLVRGGIWRTEFTVRDRVENPEVGMARSWFVHLHLLVDANFNSKRKARLQWLWGEHLVQAGGERPTREYAEPVDRMDAYVRYLRKDMDYRDWRDDELKEAVMFLMSERAPVLTGAFGTWSDRTREGRPYGEAKRDLVIRAAKSFVGVTIPEIDFTDVEIVSRRTKEHQRCTVLAIYPAVRGHGMEIEQAAAAELVGMSVGKFFRKLRTEIYLDREVVGLRTGEVGRVRDVLPRRTPEAPDNNLSV